jgi:hypothetical protein
MTNPACIIAMLEAAADRAAKAERMAEWFASVAHEARAIIAGEP